MKKIIVLLLAAVMTISAAGCGSKNENTSDSTDQAEKLELAEVKDAVEILTNVWDKFDEALGADNMFPIAGGGYENMTMDIPGVVDPADTDSLTALLQFPAESTEMIDDAASMMHAMNANTFTAGTYHLIDASDQQALADSLKDSIMNTQWLCGFPETLVIAGINDDYVVTCIGNADLVEIFKTNVTEIYGAAVLYEESLM